MTFDIYIGARWRLLLLTLALACGGCDEQLTVEEIGAEEAAITYGEDALDQVNQRATVRLTHVNGSCSGTLIAPTVVISAGHCAYPFNGDPLATNPYAWQPLASNVQVRIGGTASNPAWTGIAQSIRYTIEYDVVALQLTTPVPSGIATPWRVITRDPSGGLGTSSTELSGIQNVASARGFENDLRMYGWGLTNKWDVMRSYASANGAPAKHLQCLSTENDSLECIILSGQSGNELHHYRWQSGQNNNLWTDTLISSTVNAIDGRFSCTSWGPGRIDCFWNQYNSSLGRGETLHAYWDKPTGWGTNLWASSASHNMVGSPSCTSWGPLRLDCFTAANATRNIIHTWWNASAVRLEQVPNISNTVGSPSCTSSPGYLLHCAYVTNLAGSIRNLAYLGWSSQTLWTTTFLGAKDWATEPTIVRFGADKVLVVDRSVGTNLLWSRRLSGTGGTWSAWNSVNGMTSVFNPRCASPNQDGVNCIVSEGSDYRSIGFVESSVSWDTSYYTLIGGTYSGMPTAVAWWTVAQAPRFEALSFNSSTALVKRTFMNGTWQYGPTATRLQMGFALAQPETIFDMVTVRGATQRGSHTAPGDSGGPLALRLSRNGVEEFALLGVLQGTGAWADANPPSSGVDDRYTPSFLQTVRPGAPNGTLILSQWFESFASLGALTGPLPN